jgi:hypothetical protein
MIFPQRVHPSVGYSRRATPRNGLCVHVAPMDFCPSKENEYYENWGGGAIFCLEFIYLCGLHCVKHDCCSYTSLKQG